MYTRVIAYADYCSIIELPWYRPTLPLPLSYSLLSSPSSQDNMGEMPAAMLLVGNKVDLDEINEREVSTETGETFAKVRDKSN